MIRKFFDFLFNSIYKENCCVCNCSKAENFLCKSCAKSITFLSGFAHTKIDGVNVFSVCLYDDILKKLVQNYKFRNKMNIRFIFAEFLKEFYNNNFEEKNYAVVFVPSHKNRIRKRGYNHMKLICDIFCEKTGLIKKYDLVEKIKDTKPHFGLNSKARQSNVRGSFKINKNIYNNENILIIDDLITTGATLSEIIKELKANGIKNITCLTVCKV